MKIAKLLRALVRTLYYRFAAGNQGTISIRALIGERVALEGKNSIGTASRIENVRLGYGTYIASHTQLADCMIGRYCSIGSHVSLIVGRHPSGGYMSTHPAFYSANHFCKLSYVGEQTFEEFAYADDKGNRVIIGHDVWIGNGVMIREGVRIGDGAIIAAGAVVMKDVEPYSIVGGVPARLIRMRFTPEQIEKLQEIQWWNRDEAWLRRRCEFFGDTDAFILHADD